MNARVMLIAAVALQGCDWAAGERLARCNAGDLSQCDDAGASSDAGTSDAGTSDAGTSDAGTSDAGFDAGFDAGSLMTTFGLYPNVNGGLWHVFNEGGRGVVHVVDGGLPRELRLGGAVVQAYADSPTSTWLALLVGTSSLVVVDPFDGGTFETPATADLISVYRSGMTDSVSLWSRAANQYSQRIVSPVASTRSFLTTFDQQTACGITFDDLEVLPPPADRVVIAYRSSSCPPSSTLVDGVASGDAGIQFITVAGLRGAVEGHPRGAPQRVGRASNGFNVATQNQSIQTSKYVWNTTLIDFSLTGCAAIAPMTGSQLELGDVSDGFVTGVVNGGLVVGMSNATLPAPEPTAFLARVCDTSTPWVEPLGPATLGARVPVLVQGGRVFVSVQRPDGGVELVNRDLNGQ